MSTQENINEISNLEHTESESDSDNETNSLNDEREFDSDFDSDDSDDEINNIVYIPTVIEYNRHQSYLDLDGEHVINQHNLGAYKDYDKALERLMKYLANGYHLYDGFRDSDDYYEVEEYDAKRFSIFFKKFRENIKTFEDLEEYCEEHGDTYYGEEWRIKIEKRKLF